MNVLFLTRRFYPEIGGVEKHVLEVSKELIKRGHKVTVATESSGQEIIKIAKNYHSKDQSDTYSINSDWVVKSIQNDSYEAKNIAVFKLNVGKNNWLKKFRIWAILFRNIDLFREADVVHCHDVFFWYLPFRFLLPFKKVFVTFHGFETKFPPEMKAKLVRKISELVSNGNICVGDYIRRWYGTNPDFVTYGGVGKAQNSPPKADGPMAQKFKRKTLNILLVGRLEEDNGAKIYLKALSELRNKKISYKLTICGDGNFRSKFQKYGVVKGFTQELNKYIERSDFIFASSYLSILEALFRGKKVFSVFQNELKEDYLNLSPISKFISIASDADFLTEQILFAIKNPDITYNKTNLGQRWAARQTWGKVANIYLKLWKS